MTAQNIITQIHELANEMAPHVTTAKTTSASVQGMANTFNLHIGLKESRAEPFYNELQRQLRDIGVTVTGGSFAEGGGTPADFTITANARDKKLIETFAQALNIAKATGIAPAQTKTRPVFTP